MVVYPLVVYTTCTNIILVYLFIYFVNLIILHPPKYTNYPIFCIGQRTVRAGLSENMSSGICGQRRLISACASAQSDQGLCFPLKDSLYTIDCIN